MLMQAFGRRNVSSCRYQTRDILLSCTTAGTGDSYQHVTNIHYHNTVNPQI